MIKNIISTNITTKWKLIISMRYRGPRMVSQALQYSCCSI